MRITRLDLLAFGLFTDRSLLFDSKNPGLHIVFGPNEAGKSTSLRALKALLYGFPERTSDNFRHANDQLLVGGCVQDEGGRKLSFQRRKKRKADILNPDGSPMDPGRLAAFLHGIDPALFESLYGIDHKRLVEGGEDILGAKGEVGQALFAAGAGISSLKKIMDSLDAEADTLFKARGSRQEINKAIREYNELKKTIKEKSLSAVKWKEHKKLKKEAEDEQARLENKRRQKNAELKRLERLHRAIPELAELENLKKQMRELGDAVVLPPEFSEQLRQVEQEIRDIRLQLDKDNRRLEELKAGRDNISTNQAVLDHAEAIEDLHQRLGEYRKGIRDRGKLDGMRIAYRTDAGRLIKTVRPDLTLEDAESLRPVLSRKRTIQALSSRYEALTQQEFSSGRQKDDAQKQLSEIAKKLSGLPDARKSDGLAKALKEARRAGDIDIQIKKLVRGIEEEKNACRTALKRAGLWTGNMAQLPELTLPLLETVRRFDDQYNELENEKKQLKKERKKAGDELKKTTADNRAVAYLGEVPTERDLEASREKRQAGWRLLRRRWIDHEDVSKAAEEYAQDQLLHDAYEKQVEQADHVADRLRREADRVARAASIRAEIESLEKTIREISLQEVGLRKREDRLGAEWRSQWESIKIDPLPPAEMIAWLTDIDRLRFRVIEIINKENEAAEKDTMRRLHRMALTDELKALGECVDFSGRALAPVLEFAEEVLEKISENRAALERAKEKQMQIQKALDKAKKDQAIAQTAKKDWRTNWNKALSGLGIGHWVLPVQAIDMLETIGECFDKLEKARELQSRIKGIDRDVEKFGKDARFLINEAACALKDLPLDHAVLRLHEILGLARENNNLLKKNKDESDALSAKIKDAKKNLNSLDGRMTELLVKAGCDKAADLAEAVRRSAEFRRLREKISDATATLAKMSEGVSMADIKQQAQKVTIDELPGRISSLKIQIEEELHPKIKEISTVIGEENKELQLMDGHARAAEAAEETAQVAARIQRLVDQYVLIKLAVTVLKKEIERYREKNQDPVLRIASKYFEKLTIGAFAGLRTDIDDKGAPVLVGVRPKNTRLLVEKMSSGTRDQLYLALRLATLESRLKNSEPMPFIVDDILINFDDVRTCATLAVLSELAQKNQVILFTHHRQVVQASYNIGKKDLIYVHELGSE